MLWHKSWLETRWRFLIGLALLICSASVTVFTYPKVLELMPLVPATAGGELGARIRESAEIARTFRGFVWLDWFRQNHSQLATIFAVLLGSSGLLSSSGGALFTLSLPISRRRLLAVRAATGLAELFLLALIPSLLIPILAPAIGQSYGVGSALIHAICLFFAAAVLHNLAFLLSTVFTDAWRPVLFAIAAAMLLALVDRVLRGFPLNLYRVMSAESYFRHGEVPWIGLVVSGAIAAALYSVAVANLARRDF